MHQIYGNVKKCKEKTGQGKDVYSRTDWLKTAVRGSFVEICSWREDWTSQWKGSAWSRASFYPRNKSARTSLIRRIRPRKRRLKGVFKLLQLYRAYSVQFVKCCQFFLELKSKRLYWSSREKKRSLCKPITRSWSLSCVHVPHKTWK